MKKILAALLALITIFSVLSLTACGSSEEGVPDGMQLVRGGESDGYYFYGPEEWVVANVGDIACTYVSTLDNSSMTFVETEKPTVSIDEYFANEMADFPYEITLTPSDDRKCLFGDAEGPAYKYVFSYEYPIKDTSSEENLYKNVGFTCMQIFGEHAGRFYIFTYTAANEIYTSGMSYYSYHLDKVTAAIDAFKFVEKTGSSDSADYEKNENGDILVSNKVLAGFDMYVPESYSVDISSAIVSVSKSGVNITVSEMTYNVSDEESYWAIRSEDVKKVADTTVNAEGERVSSFTEISVGTDVDAGNADMAAAYEYTYSLDGVSYHVYQILFRVGSFSPKLYVYTYTATEECYSTYLDEAISIFSNIEY